MKLKSFGCSFIFGSELADDGRDKPYTTASQLTWPAHLAQHLDQEYQCYARPGAGNLQILEQVLIQAASSASTDLFVVGWTWIDRFDYYTPEQRNKHSPWSTIMPIDETPLAHTYYKELHSEYRDKFSSLSYLRLAIDTLNQKGIPFIMTYMDELLFDTQWHTTPAIIELQNFIKPHMTKFEGKSFLDWSRSKGFEETAAWHPLEDAHAAAGEYMIKVFDKQNIIDR